MASWSLSGQAVDATDTPFALMIWILSLRCCGTLGFLPESRSVWLRPLAYLSFCGRGCRDRLLRGRDGLGWRRRRPPASAGRAGAGWPRHRRRCRQRAAGAARGALGLALMGGPAHNDNAHPAGGGFVLAPWGALMHRLGEGCLVDCGYSDVNGWAMRSELLCCLP